MSRLFSRWVDNWILWVPESSTVWKPENVKKVWSRGLDIGFKSSSKLGRFEILLQGDYQIYRSTNEAIYSNQFSNQLNKQVIYAPQILWLHRASLSYNSSRISIHQKHIGKVYTSPGNDDYLSAFNILGLSFAQTIQFEKVKLILYAEANNILSEPYETIPGRPMPLIHLNGGLQFEFLMYLSTDCNPKISKKFE